MAKGSPATHTTQQVFGCQSIGVGTTAQERVNQCPKIKTAAKHPLFPSTSARMMPRQITHRRAAAKMHCQEKARPGICRHLALKDGPVLAMGPPIKRPEPKPSSVVHPSALRKAVGDD